MDDLKFPNTFTLLNYNLDFRNFDQDARLNNFLSLVKEINPDVVFVQECSRLILEKLNLEMKYLDYKRFISDSINHRTYYECVFSKHNLEKTMYVSFPKSTSNRGLTMAKIKLENSKDGKEEELWLINTQLDNDSTLIKDQISSVKILLRNDISPGDNVIFGGDFKILEYQKFKQFLEFEKEGWCDSWYDVGDDENKFTVDHSTNITVPPPFKDRPDRIYYKLNKSSGLTCISHKIVGREFEKSISSHYGILLTFRK